MRPSKEALIWNSLNRQAMTQPVVALERPTWSLTMMGVLMEVPTRVLQMMSKSASLGVADWDSHVNEAREVSLQAFDHFGEGLQVLDLNLLLLLGDGEGLQLATVLLGASLNHLLELQLISL